MDSTFQERATRGGVHLPLLAERQKCNSTTIASIMSSIARTTKEVESLKTNMGVLVSSYTKAINVRYKRHGSLFQHHTKAKRVQYEEYLTTIVMYMHQNPLRGGLVKRLEDWEFSSYRDYTGMKRNTFVRTGDVLSMFPSVEDFVQRSQYLLQMNSTLHALAT